MTYNKPVAPRPAIIMLTRIPENGTGKQRLSGLLSEAERIELQNAMITDEYCTMKRSCENVLVFCTPFSQAHVLYDCLGKDALLLPQKGATLGEKMEKAFEEAFDQGFYPCLLAGSDIPSLSQETFNQAFKLLEDNDVVISPTKDGGYCLIGLNEPCSMPFADIEYGTDSVFSDTRKQIEEAGLSLGVTQVHSDLDTPDDLKEFMRNPALPQCPRTNAVLEKIMRTKALSL